MEGTHMTKIQRTRQEEGRGTEGDIKRRWKEGTAGTWRAKETGILAIRTGFKT